MDRNGRNQGLVFAAVGVCVIVLAVLLFGLTTSTGAVDVVSVVTAIAGAGMVGTGSYQAFHHPRPHSSV
jgi:hypothetical protein